MTFNYCAAGWANCTPIDGFMFLAGAAVVLLVITAWGIFCSIPMRKKQ